MSHFTGYGAYLLFLALRTHFHNAKYDFFQMHGKLRASKESYQKRHDKYFFEKMAKEFNTEELRDFYVANILKDKHYITELLDDDANKNFIEYIRRKQALSYNFASELDKLFGDSATRPFIISNSQYPDIVGLHLSNIVSPETMVILNDYIPFIDKFDKQIGNNDPVWGRVSMKLRKYKPFVRYDKDKIKGVLKKTLNNT